MFTPGPLGVRLRAGDDLRHLSDGLGRLAVFVHRSGRVAIDLYEGTALLRSDGLPAGLTPDEAERERLALMLDGFAPHAALDFAVPADE